MNSSGFEIQSNNMRSKEKSLHVVVVRGKTNDNAFLHIWQGKLVMDLLKHVQT